MKSFFKTLFASTLGVIIGSVVLAVFGFMILGAIIASSEPSYTLEDKTILKIDLTGSLNEREESDPFAKLMGSPGSMGLDDVLDAIKKAKENDKVKGIYIKAGLFESGIGSVDAIRSALVDFKESGKFVVAYGDIYMQSGYYIASVADKVIMNPKGMIEFQGLGSTIRFTKNFYDKIGVKYQIFKVGTFKSAVEPISQEKMSDANRLQTSSVLNDAWSHILTGISKSRNISVENLNLYADQFLLFSDPDSIVKKNMVDTLMYESNVDEYLKKLVEIDADKDLRLATVKNMTSVKSSEKADRKNKIAVLYAEGNIVDDMAGSSFMAGTVITAKEYVKELNKLKDNEDVKAVVFRVNSRGGSAYASEQIWNAVVELKKKKPVIVSMGDYAASGGYYISCAANTIVAEPSTITGSIGIFGIFPNGAELAEKMGYTFDEVKTNKHSNFGGGVFGIPFIIAAYSKGLDTDESAMMQEYVERGYDLFITRCADGRSKTKAQIDSIGQGRIWTGNQALKNGLVDKLGGVNDAIKLAVEQAKLTTYSIEKYPEKKDFFTQLMEESFLNSKMKIVKMFVGEEEYQQQILMQQLQNYDIQMAIMPQQVNF